MQGAPLHRHSREDEYSYVIEGRFGALLGDEVVYGEVGDLIFKPRGQWHSFWNAGDTPARTGQLILAGSGSRQHSVTHRACWLTNTYEFAVAGRLVAKAARIRA